MSRRVLIVDLEPALDQSLRQLLAARGHEVAAASDATAALKSCRQATFHVVLADAQGAGVELVRELGELSPETVVVVTAGSDGLPAAAAALRAGAYDLLRTPVEDPALASALIGRAMERVRLVERSRALQSEVKRKRDELEAVNFRLADLANRDPLTGLYNQRFFREAVELELSRARRHQRPFSLVAIDVDRFTEYNEQHGQLAGDDLLRTSARILQTRCRSSTTLARFGGGKFALLVPEVSADGAATFACGVRDAVGRHNFASGENVTFSLGVASFPEAGEEAAALIDRAEHALRRAKSEGRNRVSLWEPFVAPVSGR